MQGFQHSLKPKSRWGLISKSQNEIFKSHGQIEILRFPSKQRERNL